MVKAGGAAGAACLEEKQQRRSEVGVVGEVMVRAGGAAKMIRSRIGGGGYGQSLRNSRRSSRVDQK